MDKPATETMSTPVAEKRVKTYSSTAAWLGLFLQTIEAAAQLGILIVLTMILVQLKRLLGDNFYWNVEMRGETPIRVAYPLGTGPYNPVYIKALQN